MHKCQTLGTKLTGAWHILTDPDNTRMDFYRKEIMERPLPCDNVVNMAVLKNIKQFEEGLKTRRVAAAHSSAGNASSSH